MFQRQEHHHLITCNGCRLKIKKVRNSKVWEFMGNLVDTDPKTACMSTTDDQLYCKLCFKEQKSLKDKGHVQ